VRFGWAAPSFAGSGDAHIDTPCIERIRDEEVRDAAILCEELGFHSFWLADHLILGRGGAILECWTMLSAVAALTRRLRLGTLVLCENHRNPALAAKMAATLDVISGGRLDYGVGAGWHRVEQEAYSFAWNPEPAVRIRRMEESVIIAKAVWTQERLSYPGRYYTIEGVSKAAYDGSHLKLTTSPGNEKFLNTA